ncbi:hypothetical protein SAMN05216326_12535 [Nitrosomonas marina]|uniref:Uncharacterized protein n=1 Tax=Nitrosomonas marina TaxID=917 RepID=A0A1I0E6Q9_9PROT|nr:hypothetical protein [Nitrosomonas marina]SET40740.1 hypothetical protein SAMN05216326_12535 [Nitrosomonas marina]
MTDKNTKDVYAQIVDRIVEALGVTKVEFGQRLDVSKSVVNSWRITGIPGKYCKVIEIMLEKTSDPMTKKDLRPFDWWEVFPELKIEHKNLSHEDAA